MFNRVERGHEAQYTCRAVGLTGREEYGLVDIRVKKGESRGGGGREEGRE